MLAYGTVNSEIFARVLLSRAKVEPSRYGENTLPFTVECKSFSCCERVRSKISLLTLLAINFLNLQKCPTYKKALDT